MSDRLPRPEPRDAFKRALRAQLMAQAPTALARRETVWSLVALPQGSWLRPAFAVAAVFVLLVAGAGKAAADSLPGDLTFGLKTAAEELQLALALDDTTRLKVLSEDADHRLAELTRALTSRPEAAPTATAEYAAAVARFTAAVDELRGKPGTSEDKRTEAKDVVDAARQKHEAVLDELEKTAPEDAQQGLERARQEADKLRPSNTPDRLRTPEPTRAVPARTAEPTRASEPPRGGEPTRTPLPTRP